MSLISTWSTVANDNGTLGSTPFYWPEGQAPSTVNDCARLMMSTIRTQWNDAQWFNWGYTTARVSNTSFTVVTASWNTVTVANVFQTGGRLRLHDTSSTIYATITTVSVSAASVLVSFTPDSGTLSSTCSAVYNSIITADQKSIPSAAVPADVVRQSGAQIYGVDAGSSDAYAINMTPTLTSYAAGESFNFKANTANTGAATLNIDGLGAKSITNTDGSALADNTIVGGGIVHVVYDGTKFQLVTGSGGGGGGSTAGRLIGQTILTSGTAATYTTPIGVTQLVVEAIGGGGGGGGMVVANSQGAGAAGGGGGAYCRKLITSAAATYTYTVGAAGAGGAAGNNNGTAGTASTFDTISAGAGGGGAGSPSTAGYGPTATHGAGGVASGGDLNVPGQGGMDGSVLAANGAACSLAGAGGASVFNDGVQMRNIGTGSGIDGFSGGANTGAGGGGAAGCNTIASKGGGDGGSGIIIVWEYS